MFKLPKRISKKPEEGEYTTVKVPNDLITEVDSLVDTKGYKSRGEIIKEALRNFLRNHLPREELSIFNHDENGVRIKDLKLGRIADIQFTPKAPYCPLCDAHHCEHIRFALQQVDVQKILKNKGWHYDFSD